MVDLVLAVAAIAQEIGENLVDDVHRLPNGVTSVITLDLPDERDRPGAIGDPNRDLSPVDSPMLGGALVSAFRTETGVDPGPSPTAWAPQAAGPETRDDGQPARMSP
jgi:hypothetical protein